MKISQIYNIIYLSSGIIIFYKYIPIRVLTYIKFKIRIGLMNRNNVKKERKYRG